MAVFQRTLRVSAHVTGGSARRDTPSPVGPLNWCQSFRDAAVAKSGNETSRAITVCMFLLAPIVPSRTCSLSGRDRNAAAAGRARLQPGDSRERYSSASHLSVFLSALRHGDSAPTSMPDQGQIDPGISHQGSVISHQSSVTSALHAVDRRPLGDACLCSVVVWGYKHRDRPPIAATTTVDAHGDNLTFVRRVVRDLSLRRSLLLIARRTDHWQLITGN